MGSVLDIYGGIDFDWDYSSGDAADYSGAINNQRFEHPNRKTLLRFFEGTVDPLLMREIYPKTANLSEAQYIELMQYFAYVNLCKPSVNRIVAGVYGNPVSRVIAEGSRYKAEVDLFLSPVNGYGLKCRDRFQNAVLFGDGIMSFVVQNNVVKPWLPNPICTRIIHAPDNCEDVWAVLEKTNSGFRGIDKQGWFVLDNKGNTLAFAPHGLSECPVVIAYGERCTMHGKVHGNSLVAASVEYSAVATRLMLNMVELVKTYTDPQAAVSGKILNESDPFAKGAVLEMADGGKFEYVSPSTNFKDLLELVKTCKTNFCISSNIPLDALDPSQIPDNMSATGSILRNEPLNVTINRQLEEMTQAEIKALYYVGALYQYIHTSQPVNFDDFKGHFQASVTMRQAGDLSSLQELATAWKLLIDMGAKTQADSVRYFNPTASEPEIEKRIADLEAKPAPAAEPSLGGEIPPTSGQPSDSVAA